MCETSGVKRAMVIQDPTNDKRVHIHAVQLELVQLEQRVNLESRFRKFEIKFFNDTRPSHTQSMAGIVKKQFFHDDSGWQPFPKRVRCELLVYADEMKAREPITKHAVYAVVPAHLIFEENQPLDQNISQVLVQPTDSGYIYDHPTHDIDESRRTAEQKTTRTRYTIETDHLQTMLTVSDYNLSHPPLFCYRQCFFIKESKLAETREDYTGRGQGVKVRSCPVEFCHSVERSECRHLYMNDLALLYIAPIDQESVVNLMKVVTRYSLKHPMMSLLSINSMDDVANMCNQGREIAIAGYKGRLCRPPMLIEEGEFQYAIRLPFILTSGPPGFVVKI